MVPGETYKTSSIAVWVRYGNNNHTLGTGLPPAWVNCDQPWHITAHRMNNNVGGRVCAKG